MSSGQARHVDEAGNSTSGTTPQIILFIGGNLLNADPNVSVTRLTRRFNGAKLINAGGGGEAACVNATASEPGSVAMNALSRPGPPMCVQPPCPLRLSDPTQAAKQRDAGGVTRDGYPGL